MTGGSTAGSVGGHRVAVALYSDLDFDGRVLREAESLAAAGHDVTVYCLSWGGPDDTPFRVVAKTPDASDALPDGSSPFHARTSSGLRRLVRRVTWMRDYRRNLRAWGRWAVETAGDVDVWHAHDLPALMAVGPFLPPDVAFVYDSHEIFLESGTATRMPSLVRRGLARYERRLVRRAYAVVTVNDALAEQLEARVSPARIVVVRNCVPRWDPPEPPRHRIRQAVGIDGMVPLVLYHGALGPHRGIEQTVAALSMPGLEQVHLVLLGFGDISRMGLETALAWTEGRVHRLPAVVPAEVLEWVCDADVEVMALQHSTLNHWLSTPNKLWESLAAGVPVVVSDFPVLSRVVLEDPDGPLGATCQPDDPASIAAAVSGLLARQPEERADARSRCLKAAHLRWNWETESARLVALYASLPPRG